MAIHFLYGACGGDIIGSRFERYNLKSKDFQLFASNSTMTDDTVMTAAAAEALMEDGDFAEYYRKWACRYPNAGYGGRFIDWLRSKDPCPYNSWGNGSAMRVSPVGFAAGSVEEVLEKAKASAEVTHNHPEGIKGAQAAALAVFMARSRASKEEIRQEMQERFKYDLSSETLDEIRPYYMFDVSCQGTLPVALLAFLESEDYEDAVRNAVSVGGDSDTIAAITGGIAFAFYGDMPEFIVQGIEDRLPDDIRDVCRRFTRFCFN